MFGSKMQHTNMLKHIPKTQYARAGRIRDRAANSRLLKAFLSS